MPYKNGNLPSNSAALAIAGTITNIIEHKVIALNIFLIFHHLTSISLISLMKKRIS